jgi:hypothetical protein
MVWAQSAFPTIKRLCRPREWRSTKEILESRSRNAIRGFMMNKTLVVLKQRILLLSEIVRLKRDSQRMRRLRWGFPKPLFAFMNSLHQIEVGVALLGLLAWPRIEPCCVSDVRISKDMLIKPIQSLPLVFGRTEQLRIKADGVLGATWCKLVRLVEETSRSSPPPIQKTLIEFGC